MVRNLIKKTIKRTIKQSFNTIAPNTMIIIIIIIIIKEYVLCTSISTKWVVKLNLLKNCRAP